MLLSENKTTDNAGTVNDMSGLSLCLGSFDGVHIGHEALIKKTADMALSGRTIPAAFVFTVPPKLSGDAKASLLTTCAEKTAQIRRLGIERVISAEFSDFKDISADDFCVYLRDQLHCRAILCGFNFRFGHGASGDTAALEAFCRENGIGFCCVQPVEYGGAAVSSSRIRRCVEQGKIEEAAKMLGRAFAISGSVAHGKHIGTGMGFPTVNLPWPAEVVRPFRGVYISRTLANGKEYPSVSNFGVCPTFEKTYEGLETHILRKTPDLYGKTVKVELLKFLRPERKFENEVELKRAVADDIEDSEEFFRETDLCRF